MNEQWRCDSAYRYLDSLGSIAFSWEFLRRNPDYRAAYRSIASGNDAVLVARRWGCAADPDLRADHPSVAWLFAPELTH
jgi:Proteobacterial transcriptional regulator-like domain